MDWIASPFRLAMTAGGASYRKNSRSRGLAGLEIAMRLRRVIQRIGLVDGDLDGAAADHLEELLRRGDEVLALCSVGVERRPRQIERALAGEDVHVKRIDFAGCCAEQRHEATRPNAVERLHEGVLAHRIIDDGQQLAAGDVLDAGDEILARIDDGMVAAMRLR